MLNIAQPIFAPKIKIWAQTKEKYQQKIIIFLRFRKTKFNEKVTWILPQVPLTDS